MRLIDIEPLQKEHWHLHRYVTGVYAARVEEMELEEVPTVDAAPVVHSRWIEPVPGDGFPYCGNCKAPALDKGLFLNPKLMDWYKTKYCPNCGAKMDLEEQENAT